MIYAEAACLTMLLFIGLIGAYTDIKTGLVPNRLILTGLLVSVPCHISLMLLGALPYYPYWLLCMGVADLIAVLMYFGKLWAAGDAKLFMVLYLLTPPCLFDAGQLSNSIVPYICIFIPALLWVLGDSIIRWIHKEPRKKQTFNVKAFLLNYLKTIIEITAIHYLIFAVIPDWAGENALLVFTFVMVYAYVCGSIQIMQKWPVVLIHAVIIAGILIATGISYGLPDYKGFLVLAIVIGIQYLAGMYNYQLIPTSKTRKGMIPSMDTVILFQPSKVQNLPTDPSEQLTAKMTEEQADAVVRWGTSSKGKPNIWIVRKVPFAFMIALGFVSWMIIRLVR